MPTCTNNIVQPQILSFQARYATVLHYRKMQAVRPTRQTDQEIMLKGIWNIGKLGEGVLDLERRASGESEQGDRRGWLGWKRLGWVGEEVVNISETGLFNDVGELGLECLVRLFLI